MYSNTQIHKTNNFLIYYIRSLFICDYWLLHLVDCIHCGSASISPLFIKIRAFLHKGIVAISCILSFIIRLILPLDIYKAKTSVEGILDVKAI
jgi:hypothetical protein